MCTMHIHLAFVYRDRSNQRLRRPWVAESAAEFMPGLEIEALRLGYSKLRRVSTSK